MSDPGQEFNPLQLLHILWAGAVGLIFWNGKRVIARQDELAERKADREELRQTLIDMREERIHMHTENQASIRELRSTIDTLRIQIVDLWKGRNP